VGNDSTPRFCLAFPLLAFFEWCFRLHQPLFLHPPSVVGKSLATSSTSRASCPLLFLGSFTCVARSVLKIVVSKTSCSDPLFANALLRPLVPGMSFLTSNWFPLLLCFRDYPRLRRGQATHFSSFFLCSPVHVLTVAQRGPLPVLLYSSSFTPFWVT